MMLTYDVVQLSRQREDMKDNPAYVDVGLRTPASIDITNIIF